MYKFLIFSLTVIIFLSSCVEKKETDNSANSKTGKRIPEYMKAFKHQYNYGVQDTIGILEEEQKFDSIGNKIEHTLYINANIYFKYVYRYDSQNRLTEELTFGKDGKLKLKTKIFYDSTGKRISELSSEGEELDYFDKIVYKNKEVTYRYNSLGLLVNKLEVEGGRQDITTEHEYDSNSRLVNTFEIIKGKKKLSENILYYSNRNKREEKWYFDNSRWERYYNFVGDTVTTFQYQKQNQNYTKRIDIFNTNKNIIQLEMYNSLKEPMYVIKYYYEYY